MTEKSICRMLRGAGFPLAYHHFEEGKAVKPPFLVYFFPESKNFSGDGRLYQRIYQLNVELYTDKKDLATERKLENVLTENGFFYQKSEIYVETEKLYQIIYETEVLIDE